MSQWSEHAFVRGCLGKRGFLSRKEAMAAAKLHTRALGGSVKPYCCSWCGCWHNGKRRPGKVRRAYRRKRDEL